MTANAHWPKEPSRDQVKQIEAVTALTVLNAGITDAPCGDCGQVGLLFHVHCWREDGRPIRDLCRACAIARAGGEERIWLRNDRKGLDTVWQQNHRRPSYPRPAKSGPLADNTRTLAAAGARGGR